MVEGECPRCGRLLDRGQRAHLQACTGAKPARQPRQSRPRHEEELEVGGRAGAFCQLLQFSRWLAGW